MSEIANLERFRGFMAERDIRVHQEYVYPAPMRCWECNGKGELDGERCEQCNGGGSVVGGGFWDVLIFRECPLVDEKIWARVLSTGVGIVERGNEWEWESQVGFFELIWARDMEENECQR